MVIYLVLMFKKEISQDLVKITKETTIEVLNNIFQSLKSMIYERSWTNNEKLKTKVKECSIPIATFEEAEVTKSHQEALLGGDILWIREIVVLTEKICNSRPVNIEEDKIQGANKTMP